MTEYMLEINMESFLAYENYEDIFNNTVQNDHVNRWDSKLGG
jgi:hypothetical protein